MPRSIFRASADCGTRWAVVTVDVDVELSYQDALTGETVTVEPGTQTLTGQQAQIFARARHEYQTDQDAHRAGTMCGRWRRPSWSGAGQACHRAAGHGFGPCGVRGHGLADGRHRVFGSRVRRWVGRHDHVQLHRSVGRSHQRGGRRACGCATRTPRAGRGSWPQWMPERTLGTSTRVRSRCGRACCHATRIRSRGRSASAAFFERSRTAMKLMRKTAALCACVALAVSLTGCQPPSRRRESRTHRCAGDGGDAGFGREGSVLRAGSWQRFAHGHDRDRESRVRGRHGQIRHRDARARGPRHLPGGDRVHSSRHRYAPTTGPR